ncbi:MAG: hypothetical protein D6718_05515 [Acidobacteria bacterium]|nr:MAG: hypothetical protein D6718_05515 [Acidobacteriota bacterium]
MKGLAAAASLLLLAGPGLLACRAAAGPARACRVVIEGVVERGPTYRLQPLASLDAAAGVPRGARVRLERPGAPPIEVAVGPDGRFRLGPVEMTPGGGDRLLFSAEGCRGLCLSDPLSAASARPEEGEGVVTLRWRVVLPPLGGAAERTSPA